MKEYLNYIRQVTPYVPGDQPNLPDMIKLNTNECPYPPSPAVTAAIQSMGTDEQRLYPDPTAHMLNQAIAEVYGVDEAQVFTGVGSDDVLAMLFQTFFNSDKPVLFPDITYAFYPVWCSLFGIPYKTVPLHADFTLHIEDYQQPNGGIIFPNPNAPTGLLLETGQIEALLEANQDSVVILDEAYIDFGGISALPLLERYENLIIVQTFSKSRAMAGARIGFAIGSARLIRAVHDVKYSFNSYTMNRFAIAAGAAAVKDRTYFEEITQRVTATRARTAERLKSMGFHFPDSAANFLFITHPAYDAAALYAYLKKKHIFVRYFDQPRLRDYLRVTIGTDAQMERLFDALEAYKQES